VADVLIIDDDIDVAEVLGMMMSTEGHDVRIGYNGEEGLRFVRERVPDIALLDVEMPMLGGPGMAYQMYVRDHGLEKVPVVLLSGAVNLGEVAAQVGTPYFLAKPYRHAPLVELVKRALAERIAPVPPQCRSEDCRT
jgi:DNA-binding NtrC family response regulator